MDPFLSEDINFHDWADKLITSSKSPTVKFDLRKSKLLHYENSDNENCELYSSINTMKKMLSVRRAERRCARCKITWNSNQHLGKVKSITGAKFRNMGYQQGPSKFLFPEEILTLLEMNKAELIYENIPLPIEWAYSLLINSIGELFKYRVFRKLAVAGFNVKRTELYERNLPTTSQVVKRIKVDTSEANEDTQDGFKKKFLLLQKNGPQASDVSVTNSVDYKFSAVDNKFEFNLFFINDQVPPSVGFCDNNYSNIYCTQVKGTEAFIHFCEIKLPNLF